MQENLFFKKPTVSEKILSGGPDPEEQLLAMVKGDYWVVLNSDLMKLCEGDKQFTDRACAFKHALQTFGPAHQNLPDLRMNEGKAKNQVFHGHVNNSNGKTYVLEWTIIDAKKKIMAFIGFDIHENYKFRKDPLKDMEVNEILQNKKNQKILAYAQEKIKEAKEKFARMEKTPQKPEHHQPNYAIKLCC